MSVLVLVEHDNQMMQDTTAQVLSAALQLDDYIVLLVVGSDCSSVAEQAAKLVGVSEVLYVDHACYRHHLPENISQLIVHLSADFDYILAPASNFGKNILPRVAACLDVAQVSDVISMIDQQTFTRPIYAGNAIETVEVLSKKKLLTIRTSAFMPVLSQDIACIINKLDLVFTQDKSTFVEETINRSRRPELSCAKIVVSGGRGLQSATQFKLIEDLADTLGAAIGATRAAVDAGFISNDHQIGQTGKIVSPHLYLAIGLSGAVQHLAGMKDSKIIVAINKDEDAPIFRIADYGLVGDLFDLVPQLIDALKKNN
ncbi:MAG: electron transfer flavoprotein subunit alpha/FixB family protein [Legionella sp.]